MAEINEPKWVGIGLDPKGNFSQQAMLNPADFIGERPGMHHLFGPLEWRKAQEMIVAIRIQDNKVLDYELVKSHNSDLT